MKNIFLFTFSIFLLTSCSPTFHLKENTKIERLSISVGYNPNIATADRGKISGEVNHTIGEWNIENHAFKLNLVDTAVTKADLSITVDSLFFPSRFVEVGGLIVNTALIATAAYGFIIYEKPAYLLLGGIQFGLNNITFIKYRMKNYSSKTEEFDTRFISKRRRFKNREEERNRHLRDFDGQFYNFLEKLEKEYKKKNGIKS